MRCFINFSLTGFSNSYLIGPDNGGDAIVIDPGEMNIKLLNLIENNDFYIKHILITHNHKPHVGGIRTLLKIYDAEIYSSTDSILGYNSNIISPDSTINLSGIEVKVIEFSGHTKDSLVYKIGEMLFTGDTLGAGSIGEEENKETISAISKSISEGINDMDDCTLVFPSHGPPSTIKAERDFNPELFL
ncbi:MAG: MBL fold metallo-hydrolase [Spirochaetales bacterium]|nr:MBL fold metallo-hydrolase [Spirochaetales bacterium]